MKARVATLLSLTGVLVAGSAAALVNTQVLRNTAPAGNSVSQLVTVSDDSSSTSASVVSVPAPSSSTATTVDADDVKIYEIQGTGRVTLDKSKDVLRIVSIEGIAPWQPLSQRQIDATHVESRFVNGDAIVVFTAALANDEITYELGMDSLSTPTSASTATPPSSNSVPQGTSPSNTGSTPTSVKDDDDSKVTTSTDDKGGGKGGGGGGGGDDDHPSDDD